MHSRPLFAALAVAASFLLGSVVAAPPTCADGSVVTSDGNNCICDYGYTAQSDFDQTTGEGCLACEDTFTTYSLGASSCVCDGTSGFVASTQNPGTCDACDQKGGNVYGYKDQCLQCDASNSFDTDHGCICAPGSYGLYEQDGSAPTCTTCPTGTTTTDFSLGGAQTLADCKCDTASGYRDIGGGVCSKCAAGENVFNGQCISCPTDGSSVYVDGKGCVAAVGYYGVTKSDGTAPTGGFTSCGPNKVSEQGSTTAAQCLCDSNSGFISDGSGGCIACTGASNPFTSSSGATTCLTCDANSSYDTVQGCLCDANYYGLTSKSTGKSTCSPCPANSLSYQGAQTKDQCTCDSTQNYQSDGNGGCVYVAPITPSQRARARRAFEHRRMVEIKRAQICPVGQSACPIGTLGNFECLDTKSQVDSCGGCVSLNEGVDCTALPGVAGVGCEAGRCVVFSCSAGFTFANGQCVA